MERQRAATLALLTLAGCTSAPPPAAPTETPERREKSGGVCAAEGCWDELTLRFEPALTKPGTYTIELTFDDRRERARAVVAGTDAPVAAYPCPACIEAEFSGPAGALASATAPDRAPDVLSVCVLLDETEISRTTLSPKYEVLSPNGARCEPHCRHGIATIDTTARSLNHSHKNGCIHPDGDDD